jgi:transcriptional repressor NrdR
MECERRFTTYERVEEAFPQIVKSDGSRQDYDRLKAARGIRLACSKRPISTKAIDEVLNRVERLMLEESNREISSDWIGSAITTELRDLDPVAYIRFASVYRGFSDIEEFLQELRDLDRFQRDSEAEENADTGEE